MPLARADTRLSLCKALSEHGGQQIRGPVAVRLDVVLPNRHAAHRARLLAFQPLRDARVAEGVAALQLQRIPGRLLTDGALAACM